MNSRPNFAFTHKFLLPIEAAALRSMTVASRFLLILVITKYLGASALGGYSVFSATISFGIFLTGMDFYIYANREVALSDGAERALKLRDQFVMIVVLGILAVPISFISVLFNLIPAALLPALLVVPAFEYITQELTRTLLALGKVRAANYVGFLKGGAWVAPAAISLIFASSHPSLDDVIGWWVAGLFVAYAAGCRNILSAISQTPHRAPINWDWIGNGLIAGSTFFIGTIAMKAVELGDRFVIAAVCGHKDLGIYSFYSGITVAIQTVVYSATYGPALPSLLNGFRAHGPLHVSQQAKRVTNHALMWAVPTSILAIIITPILVAHMQINDLDGYVPLLILMLATMLIYLVGLGSQSALYVCGNNHAIIKSHVLGSLVSIAALGIIVPFAGIYGAACALAVGQFFITYKKRAAWKATTAMEKKMPSETLL